MSRIFKFQLAQIGNKFEKLRNHSAMTHMGEFASNFIEMENHLQTLRNRLLYLVSASQETEESVSKGRVESQTLKDLNSDVQEVAEKKVQSKEDAALLAVEVL